MNNIKVEIDTLCHCDFNVSVLNFFPDTIRENSDRYAVFTHGYTSHKGDILSWGHRLAMAGINVAIFDLPGHYLGSRNEISSFEHFTSNAHSLFYAAYKQLLEKTNTKRAGKLVLGGHSLGGFMSIYASTMKEYSDIDLQCISVGTGLKQEHESFFMESPFYEATLIMRKQLVSEHLSPDLLFPWFKKRFQNLKITNKNIFLLSGMDDLITEVEGPRKLGDFLKNQNNNVVLKQPRRLPHHEPSMAAPYIYTYLKSINFLPT